MINAFTRSLCIGLLILTSNAPTQAQSMVEENAQMSKAFCEWSFKDKQGKEACPLIAMGVHGTGSNVMVFRLDGMTIFLEEARGKRRVNIGDGGFWDFKSKWSGTYKESYRAVPGSKICSMNDYTLSNSYSIKMKLCSGSELSDKTAEAPHKNNDISIKDFERRMNLLSRKDENWMEWQTFSPHNPSPEDSVTLRVKYYEKQAAFISQENITPPRGYARDIEFWCDNANQKGNPSHFYIDKTKLVNGNAYELRAKSVFKLIDDIEYAEEGGKKRFMVRFSQCEIINVTQANENHNEIQRKSDETPTAPADRTITPKAETNRMRYLEPLIDKHNHGIACDYVARKQTSSLGDITMATLLVEQQTLWVNFGGKDIMVNVKNRLQNGKIVGFYGELGSETVIEGKSLGFARSKDDMPEERYKFTVATNSSTVQDIDLISICDL